MRRPRGTPVLLSLLLALLPLGRARAGDGPAGRDLSELEGIDELPGGDRARAALARNGFVVLPRHHQQIFSVYIGGVLPYYVTTDSAHYTYHVLFESALADVERQMARRVRAFVLRLGEDLGKRTTPNEEASIRGLSLARAYAAVAGRLFGADAPAPAGLEEEVAAEARLVAAAAGPASSPCFGVPEDYAAYRPRGLYEGDPELERFFRAATWLGRRGFRVGNERETRAALLLVATIEGDPSLREALAAVSSWYDDMVGLPDDLDESAYAAALRGVVGDHPAEAVLSTRFAEIRRALEALPAPEINDQLLPPDAWHRFREETKGLRLLPARRTADAWLFQTLAEAAPEAPAPSALAVAEALGSARAGAHLAATGEAGRAEAERVVANGAGFQDRLGKTHYGETLRAASLLFDETSPLLGGGRASDGAAGTPLFPAPLFASDAWKDRLLTTGLSTWTSARHAWVLHAKRGENYLGVTDDPLGVVEPAPRFYAALASLARSLVEQGDSAKLLRQDPRASLRQCLDAIETISRLRTSEEPGGDDLRAAEKAEQFLAPHGTAIEAFFAMRDITDVAQPELKTRVLDPLDAWLAGRRELDEVEVAFVDALATSPVREKLVGFAALMDDLRRISEAELRGEPLSDADRALIQDYGKRIAALDFYEGNSWLEPREQMGFVVDVTADPRRGAHEAAVGAAMELYVVLPLRGGGRRLYQGGVYAWTEFDAGTPLTDGAWRNQVERRDTPPLPAWTASYVTSPDLEDVLRRVRAGEVVDEVRDLRDPKLGEALLAELEQGKLESRADDARLSWLARSLPLYAETGLHDRIVAALIERLVRERKGVVTHLAYAVREALEAVLRPADAGRLVALLRAPPKGASKRLEEQVAAMLAATRDPALVEQAEALVRDASPGVRRAGIRLYLELEREGVASSADVVDRVVACLPGASDDRQRVELLVWMGPDFTESGRYLRAEHAATLAPYLESQDPELIGLAAEAWGAAIGKTSPDGPAVGKAAKWLAERCARGPWTVSVGCLYGLGGVGTPEALAAIAEKAVDPKLGLSSVAVNVLGACGPNALPQLFRLSFEERETGDEIDGHPQRICDEAAEALDRLLGGRLGWKDDFTDEAERAEALRRVREEGRRRGFGP